MYQHVLTACTDQRVRAGSKKWLAVRRTGIGASEIAMALGIAPHSWGSPTALYYRKIGGLFDSVDNAAMEWGRRLEATILARFLKCHPEFREGRPITGRLFRNNKRTWQLATPDAIVFDTRTPFAYDKVPRTSEGVPVVVQIKTASSREHWGAEWTDEIPVYYRAQVLQEMDVVGSRLAWVPVLFNGREYREYVVEWDAKDVHILRTRGADFWGRVLERRPPDVDGYEATTKTLRDVFGVREETRTIIPPDLVEKVRRSKALLKRIEMLHDRHMNELRARMEDAAYGECGGAVVARRSEYQVNKTDWAAVKESAPDLVAPHTTKETRQRLTVHNLKERK